MPSPEEADRKGFRSDYGQRRPANLDPSQLRFGQRPRPRSSAAMTVPGVGIVAPGTTSG